MAEALQRDLELVVLLHALDLQQLVAGQHQLADQGHQIFDDIDIDADRGVRSSRPSRDCSTVALRRRWLLAAPARRFRMAGAVGPDCIAFDGLGDFGQKFGGDREIRLRRMLGSGPDCGCERQPAPAWTARERVNFADQFCIAASRFGAGGFHLRQQVRGCDRWPCRIRVTAPRRHGQFAVAELAEHILAGMRHRAQARQPQEAAGSLDGVHQAENVAQNGGVGRSRVRTAPARRPASPGFRSFRSEIPEADRPCFVLRSGFGTNRQQAIDIAARPEEPVGAIDAIGDVAPHRIQRRGISLAQILRAA